MTDKQQSWLTNIPAAYRGIYRRAMTGRKALSAIRAKCQDCQNWQPSEIRECAIETCPLWPYRMGRMVRTTRPGVVKNPKRMGVFRKEQGQV